MMPHLGTGFSEGGGGGGGANDGKGEGDVPPLARKLLPLMFVANNKLTRFCAI